MTGEAIIVIAICAVAILLFVSERLPIDTVTLLAMVSLVLTGVLTPQEGLAGFSDAATIAVAGMLVLSAGLAATGAVQKIPTLLAPVFLKSPRLGLIAMMLMVAFISAFMNNTACVAIFLPVCLGISRATRISPSKLLMPLSFAAILGGACTLIGTSPNLIVHSIAIRGGASGFEMFEFTNLGVATLLLGVAYLATVGWARLPERRRAEQMLRSYSMASYLTEVVVLPESLAVGRTLAEAPWSGRFDLSVVNIRRDGELLSLPSGSTVLKADDRLLVHCELEVLKRLGKEGLFRFKSKAPVRDQALVSQDLTLVEAVVPVHSMLVGKTLHAVDFRERFGALAIALRQRGHDKVLRTRIGHTRIEAGDVLLIEVERQRLEDLRNDAAFIIISEFEEGPKSRWAMPIALGIFTSVVLTAAVGLIPIEIGAVLGGVLMVLSGCLTLQQAYRALDWRVVFLLAGSLSLGVALEKTGVAGQFAGAVASWATPFGVFAVVGALYLATTLLTEIIANAATAAVMAPVALALAAALSWDPKPLLIAVTFACSASFMTPIGYQTNTMIYGPGQYRFADFLRIGTPLSLAVWLLATALIPFLWPVQP